MKTPHLLFYSRDKEEKEQFISFFKNSTIKFRTCTTAKRLYKNIEKYNITTILTDYDTLLEQFGSIAVAVKILKHLVKDSILIQSLPGQINHSHYQEIDALIDKKLPISSRFDEVAMYWESYTLVNNEWDRLESITVESLDSVNAGIQDRKITSLLAQLMEYKSIFSEFENVIENNFLKTEREVLEQAGKVIQKYKGFHDENWDDFFSHFISVYPGFFDALTQKSDRLTNENLKICAYIKMGVTNKEIADKMGIQTQSLLQSQSRIKKKLGLATDTTLRQYIKVTF